MKFLPFRRCYFDILVSIKAQLGFSMPLVSHGFLFFVLSTTITVGLSARPSSSLTRFSTWDISIRSSNSPESGLGNSHLSLGPGGTLGENFQDIDDEDPEDAEEEFFESEPLPVLGRCMALYAFQGQNQNFLLLNKIFHCKRNKSLRAYFCSLWV